MGLSEMIKAFFKYPTGFTRSREVEGYFVGKNAKYQKMFFNELLKLGFKRTKRQFILTGQTASLIKKIPPKDGVNEHHVRFYKNGVIECELEFERSSIKHWYGKHRLGYDVLKKTLGKMKLKASDKKAIARLFRIS